MNKENHYTKEKSSSSFSNAHSKPWVRDKSEAKLVTLSQQIQQKKDQMDEVSHLNHRFEERTDELLDANRSCFGQAEELLSQTAYYNPQKASHNHSVLIDVRQHLETISHQQMDLLCQEKNKLVW